MRHISFDVNHVSRCTTIVYNDKLIKRSDEINKLINENSFTVPTTLKKEIETNPFLRADNDNIKRNLEMNSASTEEIFGEIRKRKDNF